MVMGVAVVVRSAKRLDRTAREQARLRGLAREAAIRIRANLRADDVLREAITTAIRDVEEADVGVRVVRVESEAANVIAKINADLLGVAGE